MIKPEQVPLKVALTLVGSVKYTLSANEARERIAAALNAWPGMEVLHQTDEDYIPPRHDLILPLPKEATNG